MVPLTGEQPASSDPHAPPVGPPTEPKPPQIAWQEPLSELPLTPSARLALQGQGQAPQVMQGQGLQGLQGQGQAPQEMQGQGQGLQEMLGQGQGLQGHGHRLQGQGLQGQWQGHRLQEPAHGLQRQSQSPAHVQGQAPQGQGQSPQGQRQLPQGQRRSQQGQEQQHEQLRVFTALGAEGVGLRHALQSMACGHARCAITGAAFQHLLQLSDLTLLETVLRNAVVFARMKPHQKGQVLDLLSVRGLHQMHQGRARYIPV